MKKSIIISFIMAVAILPASTLAQDIGQAKKMYYYERWKSARTGFEQAAASNPEAAYWLVETILQTGDVAEARNAAQKGTAAFSNNPLLLVAAGHVDLYEGKATDAKNKFEAALGMADKKSKTAVLTAIGRAHGNVQLKFSAPDYAIDKVKQALQAEPRNGSIYIVLGDVYRKKLDGGAAVEAYTNAMSNDPALAAQANYKIGRVYATQQNCEVFTRYFNQATSADANFMPAYRELFENYTDPESKCANMETAKSYFDKYLNTSDQGDETELLRINFAYITKDYNGAVQKGQALLASSPKAPYRLNKLIGYSYYELKDYQNTVNWLEKYFTAETNPDNIVTHNYRILAFGYEGISNWDKARQTWMKAGEFEPDEAKKFFYFSKAADAAIKNNDKQGAASIYSMVLNRKTNPTKTDFSKVGTALYESGLYDSTIALYTKYAEKFPDDWRAPLWIARSYALKDSNMVTGEAAPYYEKMLAMSETDTTINSIKIQANLYLFAYTINVKKDQKGSEVYLDKILAIDPENATAKQYKAMLNKAPQPKPNTGTKPPATNTKPATGTKPPAKTTSVKPAPAKTGTAKTPVKTTSKPTAKN